MNTDNALKSEIVKMVRTMSNEALLALILESLGSAKPSHAAVAQAICDGTTYDRAASAPKKATTIKSQMLDLLRAAPRTASEVRKAGFSSADAYLAELFKRGEVQRKKVDGAFVYSVPL